MNKEEFEDLMSALIDFADFEKIGMDENGEWPPYIEFVGHEARIWVEFYHAQHYTQGGLGPCYDLLELTEDQMDILRANLTEDVMFEVDYARKA